MENRILTGADDLPFLKTYEELKACLYIRLNNPERIKTVRN